MGNSSRRRWPAGTFGQGSGQEDAGDPKSQKQLPVEPLPEEKHLPDIPEEVNDADKEQGDRQGKEERHDGDHDMVAVGYLDARLHVVCFTPTAGGIRVISFRKANRREARKHGKPLTLD